MAEERCDGFEAHAPIDRLGREGVAELVRVNVSESGGVSGSLNGTIDALWWDRSTTVAEEKVAAQAVGALR